MAIEKEIPRDISKVETKFAGPFTVRQLVCGIPGLGLAVGCYFLLRAYVPNDVNFFIDLVIALPFLLCGWIKPYGIPFEKFASIVFVSQFLAPKNRKYCTENTYSILKLPQSKKKDDKKKKKNIVYTGEFTKYE